MTTLWKLSDDLLTLETLIEDIELDERLSQDEKESKIQELFENWLESSQNWDEKALKVASYIRHQEAVANAQKEEAKRIMDLSKQSQRQADRMRGYLIRQMALMGKMKIEGVDGKLSLRKLPPKVAIASLESVPDEFLKVEASPKLNEIKKYLKDNPCDWASLEDTGSFSLILK